MSRAHARSGLGPAVLLLAASARAGVVYRTDFASGVDAKLMLQQPTPAALTTAEAPCAPKEPALRVSIRQDEDYSRVANGVPRAEVNFAPRFTFQPGREYVLRWSTCLPKDFRFDSKQPEGISQIHPGVPKGSPPWGLSLVSGRYQVQLRDGTRVVTRDAGDASRDRGRWAQWTLRYRPDADGAAAVTELAKDGATVVSASGVPNAYPGDRRAYLKIGLYKWWWQERPSDVTERTMYFGDVVVEAGE